MVILDAVVYGVIEFCCIRLYPQYRWGGQNTRNTSHRTIKLTFPKQFKQTNKKLDSISLSQAYLINWQLNAHVYTETQLSN